MRYDRAFWVSLLLFPCPIFLFSYATGMAFYYTLCWWSTLRGLI
jgi:hypothetical protein